ncbi:MAG: hypothetical protein R6U51_06460 [Anaerolineales bacterium]
MFTATMQSLVSEKIQNELRNHAVRVGTVCRDEGAAEALLCLPGCMSCKKVKTKPVRALGFSQEEFGGAKRRINSQNLRETGNNLHRKLPCVPSNMQLGRSYQCGAIFVLVQQRLVHHYRAEMRKKNTQSQKNNQNEERKNNWIFLCLLFNTFYPQIAKPKS